MESVAATPKYNLNSEQEKKLILREYRALLRSLKPKLKPGDKELVRQAFEMAADAHKTMRRKSGEPYILHPLAVAMICVEEIGLGVRSTICSLLHDTVEDTDITLDDVENGAFEITGVKAGTYTVIIEAKAPNKNTSKEGVVVADGKATDVGEIKLGQ